MISVQIVDEISLIAFWLCFTRWMMISIQLPIFDNVSVPNLVKVLGSLMITFAFFPYLKASLVSDIQYVGKDGFWILTIFHAIVGIFIGFFVKAIMNLFVASGSIITQQVGFAAVRYFDPNSSQQVGPFEQLIHWTVLIMVLTSGALLPMFKGVFASFNSIHIYQFDQFAKSPIFFLEFFKSIFVSSLMLASPLIFTNMMIMSVLGIIARTVPQMNVIMTSFAVNIGLGLLVFTASSHEFFRMAFRFYTEKLGSWFQFIS